MSIHVVKGCNRKQVVADLAAVSQSPMSDGMPSPHIGRLHGLLNGIAGPSYLSVPSVARYPAQPQSATGSSGSHTMAGMPPSGPVYHISPGSSGGSRGQEGASPEESKASHRPRTTAGEPTEDVIEIPKHQQTLYDGDPVSMTPTFADMPAWLTENTTTSMPMYHRKSSDGATLRLMLDTLAGQGNGMSANPVAGGPGAEMAGDSQDPLDTSPRADAKPEPTGPSPFGSIVFPQQNPQSSGTEGNRKVAQRPAPHRRSTTIPTSWTHAPKILVVEDDVVYRQLSSKFLEKFGCIIETVEDAQQAIERMNHAKYDLVLMDIFFGPLMDG